MKVFLLLSFVVCCCCLYFFFSLRGIRIGISSSVSSWLGCIIGGGGSSLFVISSCAISLLDSSSESDS